MPCRMRLLTATVAAALMLALTPAFALIYDGSTTRVGNGPAVGDGTSTVWVASPFIVTQEAYATSFSVAVSRAKGPLDEGFDVWLTSNLGLGPDMSVVSWKVIPTSAVGAYYNTVLPEPVFLKANQFYYVVLAPTSPDFYGGVSYSAKQNAYYGLGSGDYGKTWAMLGQPIGLKVDGYYVPEPSGLVALLSGVGVIGIMRRRGR